MRVFNKDKTQELLDYDLSKGRLKDDKLFIKHHNTQKEVQQQSHYEVIREYSNGGKDLKEVIDVEYKPKVEEYDEYEDIKVFIPYTQEEINEQKIAELKRQLFNTDYKAIQWTEGEITAEEFEPMRLKRKAWREEIRALEISINQFTNINK